jgi:PAS domain S-box-containing protein
VFLTSHAEREMVERVRGITRYGYVIKNSGDFVLRSSIEMAFELFESHRNIELKVAALQESETLYRMLLENSIDAVYFMDHEGKVLNVNNVACTTLGYTRDELLQLGIGDIDVDFPKDKFMEFWRNNPKASTLVFETRHRHKDGHVIDVEVNGIFFETMGRKFLYGVARDITGRKQTEKALLAKNAELTLTLKEVHHRIKNNMNSMQALLSFKESAITDPAAIAALKDSRSRLRSLMVMYDKLYRYSDVNVISAREFLSSLVDEVVTNYPSTKRFSVEKDLDDFELDMKRGQALGIIINELLTNIIKYAFAGCEGAAIRVSVKRLGQRVEMAVADNGCGLPASFDFEKSPGFGLQLVAGLARQIAGSARVERGAGTKVVIEFSL